MSAEVWTILSVGTALGGLIIAVGGLMWRTLRPLHRQTFRQLDQIGEPFDRLEARSGPADRKFRTVHEARDRPEMPVEPTAWCGRETRRQLEQLTDDHNALARELYELRGEIRARFGKRNGPASATR